MRVFSVILTVILLQTAWASPSLVDACRELTNRDPELTKKCFAHAELFEVPVHFVRAVADFDPSVENRMKALKSGADVNTLALCKQQSWSKEGTLTCLRSYPTPELIRACKKISGQEEDQLRCVRMGRETAQVESCFLLGDTMKERFRCLEMDIPALEARTCDTQQSAADGKFKCLQRVVDRRERESLEFYNETRTRVLAEERREREGRALASEKAKKNKEKKSGSR